MADYNDRIGYVYDRGYIPEEWEPYYYDRDRYVGVDDAGNYYYKDVPTLNEYDNVWPDRSINGSDLYDEDDLPDWIRYDDDGYWGARSISPRSVGQRALKSLGDSGELTAA